MAMLADLTTISERTMLGIFLRQVERHGDRGFLQYHDGIAWRQLTWNQVQDQVQSLACGLIETGVEAGSRVVIMSPNRLEWIVSDLAIQAAGAVPVPVYPSTTKVTAQEIARDCGAVLAIVDPALADRLALTPTLRTIVSMDGEVREWMACPAGSQGQEAIRARLAGIEPDSICTIIYTSGTTGEPKGVILLNRNVADMLRSTLEILPFREEDVYLSFLPFSHVFERVDGIYIHIATGANIVLSRGIDQLRDDIAEIRPTTMCSVPRVYEKIHAAVLDQVRRQPSWRRALFHWALGAGRGHMHGRGQLAFAIADRLVLARLRQRLTGGRLRYFVSGGAPLGVEIEEFFWAVGIPIIQGWGLTETSAAVTVNRWEKHRLGTVGWPIPGVDLRLAEDGEILVRGGGIMAGYHNNQGATEAVLQDGWFRTGDIGQLDADGCLRITDRKKDLIKTAGGKYVPPQPVEARLQESSTIERAVLIGDGRPYVVALILPDWKALQARGIEGEPDRLVRDERVRGAVQAVIDAVNRDLPSFESIKYFDLLTHDFSEEAGELTPTLKVKRRVIQEHYRTQIEALYEAAKR